MPNPDPSYVKISEPIRASWANNVVGAIRRLDNSTPRQGLRGGVGGSSSSCPFGEIVPIETGSKVGLLGGVCLCGDKNFNVPPLEINITASNKYLVSLKLQGIQFFTDDDAQFIMPSIKSATGTPAYEKTTWTPTANYPDNINPATPTSTGTIYVPLGVLTEMPAVSGQPTFSEVLCGNILITQCSGVLGSTRYV